MSPTAPVRGIFIDPEGSGSADIRRLPDRSQKVLSTLLNADNTRITTVLIDGGQYDIYHQSNLSHGFAGMIPTVYINGEPSIFGPVFICRPPADCSLSDYHICKLSEHIKHKRYTSQYVDNDSDVLIVD